MITSPLQMAVQALERRMLSYPHGLQRQHIELALAIVRSYEDYEPDYELAIYAEGFKDANKIHINGQPDETIHDHKFRESKYELALQRPQRQLYDVHNLLA